jgi:hypothetical protein
VREIWKSGVHGADELHYGLFAVFHIRTDHIHESVFCQELTDSIVVLGVKRGIEIPE